MASARQTASIYQLKVTHQIVQPPIWRRLQVSSRTTMNQLHDILQVAMGWDDYHLHLFRIGESTFSNHVEAGDRDEGARLDDLALAKGSTIGYEYDFGDGWEHLIEVEGVTPPDSGARYPVCVSGERACPPEDCGGAWGYENLLMMLRDPENPDYAEQMEWIGGNFDPEAFDLDDINQRLAHLQ